MQRERHPEPDRTKRRLPPHQVLVSDPASVAALEADEETWAQVAVVQGPATLAAFRAAVKPGLAAADQRFLARLAGNYAYLFDVDGRGDGDEGGDGLPQRFPGPTLILTGRQDSICGYEEAWELIENFPRATFAVLDRAGHDLSVEQEGLFRALVNEWLDRVEEYTATPH